jgi:hypothetical protein
MHVVSEVKRKREIERDMERSGARLSGMAWPASL